MNSPTRLTVVQRLFHQSNSYGRIFELNNAGYSRELQLDEVQAYERQFQRVGEQWILLDYGWLEKPETQPISEVVIRNVEGKNLQFNPSPSELDAIATRVIEVCCGDDPDSCKSWLIYPGTCFHGAPSGRVWIRCQNGSAQYSYYVIPG